MASGSGRTDRLAQTRHARLRGEFCVNPGPLISCVANIMQARPTKRPIRTQAQTPKGRRSKIVTTTLVG